MASSFQIVSLFSAPRNQALVDSINHVPSEHTHTCLIKMILSFDIFQHSFSLKHSSLVSNEALDLIDLYFCKEFLMQK